MNIFSRVLPFCICIFCFLYSCGQIRVKKYTPVEFINHVVVEREEYSNDSAAVISQLKKFLLKHVGFFGSKEYFDSTRIIVDSIIYSPDFKKLIVFVLTQNPTTRQRLPDKKHKWYYNETCFLGVKENDSVSLSWLGPNFSNSSDRNELSDLARGAYFTEFATDDTIKSGAYKYNLNDIRFWTSAIWVKIAEEKQE